MLTIEKQKSGNEADDIQMLERLFGICGLYARDVLQGRLPSNSRKDFSERFKRMAQTGTVQEREALASLQARYAVLPRYRVLIHHPRTTRDVSRRYAEERSYGVSTLYRSDDRRIRALWSPWQY